LFWENGNVYASLTESNRCSPRDLTAKEPWDIADLFERIVPAFTPIQVGFLPAKGMGTRGLERHWKMKVRVSDSAAAHTPLPRESLNAAILEQLQRILDSPAFYNCPRAKEFLSYVVERGLEGQTELLKERSLGMNLFHRSSTYVTSDDPVVRVRAGEVRRRLAQYYTEGDHAHEVQIEIPVGSYIPRFQWKHAVPATSLPATEVPPVMEDLPQPKRRAWRFWAAAVMVILAVAATIAIRWRVQPKSLLEEFWAPVFTTNQPVLICLPSPVSYALSDEVYAKAGELHPGAYDSLADREATPVQMDSNAPLRGKDVTALSDYYVNKDDAYVAADLAGLFARLHKGSQVRIGHDFSYEDLRHSPSVLIGAFNNSWTMRVTTELPFVFREADKSISERGGQARVWRMEGEKNHGIKDFAIVARVLNSKTGQFLVVVGGIGMVGTQAAGTFLSQPGDLDLALQKAPPGWQRKSLEMVIETDVIEATASRPRVVAFTTW